MGCDGVNRYDTGVRRPGTAGCEAGSRAGRESAWSVLPLPAFASGLVTRGSKAAASRRTPKCRQADRKPLRAGFGDRPAQRTRRGTPFGRFGLTPVGPRISNPKDFGLHPMTVVVTIR